MVMQNTDTAPTRESTERVVRNLDSTYERSNLDKVVSSAPQLNHEERKLLLGLLNDFEGLFYIMLGKWDTESVDLELKPNSKPFDGRYYIVLRKNKETFLKDPMRLVDIGVITPLQQ